MLLPNPFVNPSASDAAEGQAVASILSPQSLDATADLSDSGATDCAPDEAAAPLRQSADAAAEYDGLMDCIGEIFIGAEKLNDPEARFVLDEQAFMDAIDEAPLFLRQAVG